MTLTEAHYAEVQDALAVIVLRWHAEGAPKLDFSLVLTPHDDPGGNCAVISSMEPVATLTTLAQAATAILTSDPAHWEYFKRRLVQ